MNSKQNRYVQRAHMRLLKGMSRLFDEQIKEWEKDPESTKESILAELKSVVIGVKELQGEKA